MTQYTPIRYKLNAQVKTTLFFEWCLCLFERLRGRAGRELEQCQPFFFFFSRLLSNARLIFLVEFSGNG